jgi:hypothetical protein
MSTAIPGLRSGDLSILSDAPDDPTTLVALSGTVLAHAVASLDSTTTLLAGTLDFGDHAAGAFSDQSVRVFNPGYDLLQARLWVSDGVIAGGGGRFSFVDGFASQLIAEAGHDFVLAFDDAGAVLDSTYTAMLTFTCADEPLDGALALPNLEVSLRARVTGGVIATGELPIPVSTRLYPPAPNPLAGRTTLRLDLAHPVDASLAVFDPAGRRVSLLRQGEFAAGSHSVTWDGRTEHGLPAGSGIYFVRFSAPGLPTQVVRLAIVR